MELEASKIMRRAADCRRRSSSWLLTAVALAAVVVTTTEWGSCDGCLEQERLALLDISTFFSINEWEEADCCAWSVVTCNDTTGRVTGLNFFEDDEDDSSSSVVIPEGRYLNASLFLPFEELQYLSLMNNKLAGCMANEGFEKLSILANLETLNLGDNEFSIDVVPSLSRISSLKTLYLDNNKLKGVIYIDEINKLSGLTELDLSSNGIEGFASFQGGEDLLRLPHLEDLDLSDNNLTDTNLLIPTLKQLYSLKYLSLGFSNKIMEGVIDIKELAALTKLQNLQLSGNPIVKDLAALINLESFRLQGSSRFELQGSSKLQNLTYLMISGCVLQGTFLKSIGTLMTNLEYLSIDTSYFNSTILQGWTKLERLTSLTIMDSKPYENNFLETVGTLMTNLETLIISSSSLNSTLPRGLCNLKYLYKIDLSNNDLVGELPPCLSNLTSLGQLDISHNHLSGDISQSPLTTIFSLELLAISGNLFRIPLSLIPFFNHSRLTEFYGQDNLEIYGDEHQDDIKQHATLLLPPPHFQLTDLSLSSRYSKNVGGFPKFLYHQRNLQTLTFTNIKMERAGFPWWLLVNNTNLRELILGNCSLSGPFQLPIHLSLYSLTNLDISNNNLYSPIPPHICASFPRLQILSLSNNRLFGGISKQLSSCSDLFLLDAKNNHLSGSLALGFITSRMSEVYLSGNQLGGTLLAMGNREISSVDSNYSGYFLSVLDLSHNHLEGTIPRWISKLPRLAYLLLNNNKLHGEFSVPFCLKQFKLIVISHNHITGHLSSALTTNSSCNARFDYAQASRDLELVTKTQLYTYRGTPLALMVGLDISNNNFTGEIPPQISDQMGDIIALNLSYNKLTGPIPPSFSVLLQMESLDLSHNNLSGAIPSRLTELTSLSSFSVAYNNLSGKCPARVSQFATFDESSYHGNPFLSCPLPVRPSTPSPGPPTSDDGDDDDDDGGGFIDMESFYASSGVSFIMVLLVIASVLYINPYWRRVWFYYVGITVTSCYYFVVDHLPIPVKYKVLELRV